MSEIIIYHTPDGKSSVALYAQDGNVWMNQLQLAELFDTSKQNIGQHIKNILEEKELDSDSVVKNYFTTASDGKNYEAFDQKRKTSEAASEDLKELENLEKKIQKK